MTAGPVTLTINFLSPVVVRFDPIFTAYSNERYLQPDDLVRQSLPFSYMTVDVKSNDGKAHSVQVYSDISGEWVSGDPTLVATWSTDTTTNGLITHKVQLQTQQTYTEHNDHIQRKHICLC